jgi:hypothetical protein
VRAAAEGTAILVTPGVYRENLVLDRPVTLRAEEGLGSVTLVSALGVALRLSGSSGEVHDLTVRATAASLPCWRTRAR